MSGQLSVQSRGFPEPKSSVSVGQIYPKLLEKTKICSKRFKKLMEDFLSMGIEFFSLYN